MEKLIRYTAVAVFLMVCALPAFSQQAWDTNIATWTGPTTCTTGEPITACPVTGYRLERSPSSTGAFATVATVTGTTYTHTGVTAGTNCYRVIALSAQGESGPSNVHCKNNVRPVGPPNPPTNLRVVEQTVFNLRQDRRDVLLGDTVGTVALDTICGKQAILDGYRTVARSNVKFSKPQAAGTVLVAKCA